MIDGTERPLTQDWKNAFETAYMQLGGLGERVLGFCDFMLPADKYPKGYPFDPDEEVFYIFLFLHLMLTKHDAELPPFWSSLCWSHVHDRSPKSRCTR